VALLRFQKSRWMARFVSGEKISSHCPVLWRFPIVTISAFSFLEWAASQSQPPG
jgi:hypothetical protein